MKRNLSAFLILILLASTLLFSGCLRKKKEETVKQVNEPVTLSFYGLFDSEDVYTPIIQKFTSANPMVQVSYKKFIDPDAYLKLIINELAEGKGPDIFLMHNTWFPMHYKKLTPAPDTVVNAETFRSLFVDITGKELIIPDEAGTEKIWALPIYVDTLALYYNKDYFEEVKPSTGKPSDTWAGIKADVELLNRADQSFSRFERSGIAMGRGDNISRAFDILMLLALQSKVGFYSADLTKVMFQSSQPFIDAMDIYVSFALPSRSNYSWNEFLADSSSAEKELTAFASGKTAMIMGYSYTYEEIVNEVARLKRLNMSTIDINDIAVQSAPQIYDTSASTVTRETYGSYFAPAVGRNSKNADLAWSFLVTMVSEENLRSYNASTNRPSALRTLIAEQSSHPVYGVFASQVGYASSIPMTDPDEYKRLFLSAVDRILDTESVENVVKELGNAIQTLIPATGVKPVAN